LYYNSSEGRESAFTLFDQTLRNCLLPNLYKLLRIPSNSEEFSLSVLNAIVDVFCGKIPSLGNNRTKTKISSTSNENEEIEEYENEASTLSFSRQEQAQRDSTPQLFTIDLDCTQLLIPLLEDDSDVISAAVSKIIRNYLITYRTDNQGQTVLNLFQFFGRFVILILI
jgi:hypothetical protein